MDKVRSNKLAIAVMILPGLTLYIVFIIVPLFMTLGGGFFSIDLINPPVFVGFRNFTDLFNDRLFFVAINNSFQSVIIHIFLGIIPVIVVGALLQRVKPRLQSVMTSVFLYPLVLSVVVVSIMWVNIYNPDISPINTLFRTMGIDANPLWLSDTRFSLFLVITTALWQWFGYGVIIVFAGIKSIPRHYMDAAYIDGAGGLQTFFRITMPLLAEKLKVIYIFYIIGGVATFTHNMVMTNGGPGTSSLTILLHIFRTVFSAFRFGYGIAMSSVVLVICLILCILINRFIAREKIEL